MLMNRLPIDICSKPAGYKYGFGGCTNRPAAWHTIASCTPRRHGERQDVSTSVSVSTRNFSLRRFMALLLLLLGGVLRRSMSIQGFCSVKTKAS